jgi:hypothetical protein
MCSHINDPLGCYFSYNSISTRQMGNGNRKKGNRKWDAGIGNRIIFQHLQQSDLRLSIPDEARK